MFGVQKRTPRQPFALSAHLAGFDAALRRVASVVALPWLIAASTLAVFGATAATMVGWRIAGELPDPDRVGVALNLVGLGVALLISIGTGLALPAWWRRIVGATVILPALLLVATSGNTPAALAALAVLIPTAWLGRACAARLLGPLDSLNAWVIGCTFGFGFTAALGFVLGNLGLLRPALIWPTLLALTIALLLAERRHARDDLRQFAAWLRRPSRRDPLTLLLVGIGVALLWYNSIGALSPETASDTAWVRLPTANHFAQTRYLGTADPELNQIIHSPATGEIANAVVASIGPLHAVKLLTFLQGLACALAIFGVGRRLHSSRAGLIAAFTFYTMPLVSWLSQTAYLDLLTSLLAVGAALVLISRATPDWRAAVAAGILSGLGVGVKLHFAYVAIGLAVILGVLGLRERHPRVALRLVATMVAAAALTAAPWFARSVIISGQIPGLALATGSLIRAAGEQPTVMADLTRFGFGRSLGHLLRSLLDMTIASAQFEWPPTRYGPFGGLIGFVLLGLLPLSLITLPVRRRVALALLAGGATAFVLWFYTAQYLRYCLPILALLCPLAGMAYGTTQGRDQRVRLRIGSRLALLTFILSGVLVQVQIPAMGRDVVLGREGAEQYLDRNLICCAGYPVLRLLNAAPNVTRVYSNTKLARIYIPGILFDSAGSISAADDGAALLAGLDAGGYSHIVIDRNQLRRGWETQSVTDEAFLRRNTMLVGGQGAVYLYRILPVEQRGGEQTWAKGDELLPAANVPGGGGGVRVSGPDRREIAAPITPGTTYLLSHRTRADDGAEPGKAMLSLAWRDGAGRTIATTREIVPTSPQGYHQFSTIGIAPPGAAMVVVAVEAEVGAAWFADLSLRTMANDRARP